VGEQAVREVIVTSEMTARLFDREIHPVYATAWMVRHVEEAGRMLVEPYLGADEDATGYSIALTHERVARVGERLSAKSTNEPASRKWRFAVRADWSGEGRSCSGSSPAGCSARPDERGRR
jgi:fluoroacetyl-CoA thioesterase